MGSIVDPAEGYSGIVDHIIDTISTEVDVLFEGQSEYKTFNVLNDDLNANNGLPIELWGATNGQGDYTPRIIDVVIKDSGGDYIMDWQTWPQVASHDDDLYLYCR